MRSPRHCFRSNSTYGLGSLSRGIVPVWQGPAHARRLGWPKASLSRLARVTTASEARTAASVMSAPLAEVDPDIAELLGKELGRQRDTLEMIASENFVPRSVLQAQGSVLTNKYAEGLPGRRYYGGCEYVDVVENIARDRAKALFGADFANVQPHSGAQAQRRGAARADVAGGAAAGLDLANGGHLTHGMKLNFSGKLYEQRVLRLAPDDARDRHGRGARPRRLSSVRRSSSPAGRLTRGSSTSRRSGRSPTRWTPNCGSTWRISRAWWRWGCTQARCRTPTWCPPRSTRRSAGAAPA